MTRVTRRTITFRHPARVEGIDEILPAGAYEVDTDEETVDAISFLAWRRIRATVLVPNGGTTRAYAVDATDLEESLKRDSEGL